MRTTDRDLVHSSEGLSGLPLRNSLNQSLVGGHLSCFQALDNVNSVEMKILVHVPLAHKSICRINLWDTVLFTTR